MKQIELSNKSFALVDDELYDQLNIYTWTFDGLYAVTTSNGMRFRMHEIILGRDSSKEIDHKDQNKLNNQKVNLRHATRSQSNANKQKQSNNTSGLKGVSFVKHTGRWLAYISKDGKRYSLGQFDSKEMAALVYDQKAKELFGEFAHTNFNH